MLKKYLPSKRKLHLNFFARSASQGKVKLSVRRKGLVGLNQQSFELGTDDHTLWTDPARAINETIQRLVRPTKVKWLYYTFFVENVLQYKHSLKGRWHSSVGRALDSRAWGVPCSNRTRSLKVKIGGFGRATVRASTRSLAPDNNPLLEGVAPPRDAWCQAQAGG